MKYPLSPSDYIFNALNKTITFTGVVPADISNILHVTNITRGVLYFQPQAGYDYTGTYSSPVLTLIASTVGHSDTDSLLIIYDDGLEGATLETQLAGNEIATNINEKLPELLSGRIPVDVGTSISIGEVEVNNDSGNPIPVSGTVTATGPLTNTELRASAVPISASSLPLPSGAATAANQATANNSLSSLDSKAPALVSGRIPVDGSGVTQPVSGSVTVSGTVTATGPLTDTQLRATAVPVSATSLPLPSGAATSANQTTANNSLSSLDSKSPALVSGRVPVDGSGVTQPVSGSVTVSGTVTATGPLTDTQLRATAVPVSVSSLPLPSGASTSANQTTTNTSLSSIDGKVPALQSGAVPVGDNSSSLTVDGKAYRVQLDITRPANVTPYPAGSVIGTGSGDDAILTLSSIGPSGGFVIVQSIELVLGISAVPSGMTSFRLHFYSTKPATAAANASAFDVTSADRGAYIGYIDLPAPVDLGSTCFTQVDYPGKLFKLASASTSLFCELQTIGGYTPAANSEVYSLRIKTLEAGL